MARTGDPRALGELLRSRRARLSPSDVGLPTGSRRRTPGLRREEVAALANVSTTYYTFLEQGRPVRPSEHVVDALARALLMTSAERRYLDVLANGPANPAADGWANPPANRPVDRPVSAVTDRPVDHDGAALGAAAAGAPAETARETVSMDVIELVQRLEPCPTFIKGRRWDVLAANPGARELFTDWDARAPHDRNLVIWMFTSEEARRVYVDWEPEARAMLGRVRLAAARHPNDPGFADLIRSLHRRSELVRRWWPSHDVSPIGSGVKQLRHPRFGPLAYSHVVLQLADDPSQTLVTFSLPERPSHQDGRSDPPG